MTNLFALALIATMSNALNTVRVCIAYADQYSVDHCLDGVFPTYVPSATKARICATSGMSMQEKVIYKAMRLGARRGATKAPSARVPMNDATKREAITLACRNVHAARMAAIAAEAQARALSGVMLSDATVAARAAQGAAQREANALRKAATPAKVARPHVVIVRSGPTKVNGVKRTKVYHMMHTVESVAANAATKAAVIKAKVDKEIARARRAAQRKLWIQLRAEKIARMCANAWYNKGIWIDPVLAEACNDSDYSIRVSAYTELCALVGVAA